MVYSKEQTALLDKQTFGYLEVEERENVLRITLNRPEKKNALNPVMLNELAYALCYAAQHRHIWAVLIRAKGNVFCSGADLSAMMGMAEDRPSTIPAPDGDILLAELFHHLHKPSIAQVEGDVYAGGFLILAGCTYVVACNDIKLGLPETKRGLFPFQVMASLLEVMPTRKVLDWCIRGYNLPVEEALELGLVTHVAIQETIDGEIGKILRDILSNSPSAIRLGLEAHDFLRQKTMDGMHRYLHSMLMRTLETEDAAEGLTAFREKRKPEWKGQ